MLAHCLRRCPNIRSTSYLRRDIRFSGESKPTGEFSVGLGVNTVRISFHPPPPPIPHRKKSSMPSNIFLIVNAFTDHKFNPFFKVMRIKIKKNLFFSYSWICPCLPQSNTLFKHCQPSKRHKLSLCWSNVGPPSATQAQL